MISIWLTFLVRCRPSRGIAVCKCGWSVAEGLDMATLAARCQKGCGLMAAANQNCLSCLPAASGGRQSLRCIPLSFRLACASFRRVRIACPQFYAALIPPPKKIQRLNIPERCLARQARFALPEDLPAGPLRRRAAAQKSNLKAFRLGRTHGEQCGASAILAAADSKRQKMKMLKR